MAEKRRLKDLTFWEKIYIPEIVKGLKLTLENMFKPKFTMKYPEEKFIPGGSYRGSPVLAQEENGEERCVACGFVQEFARHWPSKFRLQKLKEKKKDILRNLKLI